MKIIAKNEKYEINVKPEKNRIYLKISGYWKTKEEVPNYFMDMKSAAAALSKGFSLVTDIRDMKTPSQEISILHQETQKALMNAGLDKTAEIFTSALTKLSVKKYSDKSGMKKQEFTNLYDAEKWLDS